MKTIFPLCLIFLVSSVLGEGEVCRDLDGEWKVCENSHTITHVKDEHAIFKSVLTLDLSSDTTISDNAFSASQLELFYIEMPNVAKANRFSLSLLPNSFAGLTKLDSLNIENANLKFTGGDAMTTLGSLKILKLRRCGLTEVPTRVLESMPNLEELVLEENEITALHPNDFAPLKHLKELDVSSNTISNILPGAFNGLNGLRVLDVSANVFPATKDLFKGLTLLKELRLSKCFDHNGFDNHVLQGLPLLEKLQVGFNNITTLSPGMFNAVSSLRELSLYGNQIRQVPKGVFEPLTSLKEISLADNDIDTITPGAFGTLNLDYLIMSLNHELKTIPTDAFKGLTVRNLILSKCHIETLEPKAFNGVHVPRMLDLTENFITEVGTDDFSGLRTKDLDLSQNHLRTIAQDAFKDTELKRLGLFGDHVKITDRAKWGLDESVEIMK